MGIARRSGKIGRRPLIALCVFVGLILLGIGAFYARKYRVRVMAERTLTEGKAAFERGDYKEASKLLGRYLAKYPDDAEILKQWAQANLAVRPLEPGNVGAAISAYRSLLLVYSKAETAVGDDALRAVYVELARLYEQTGNFSELGFIARERRRVAPEDVEPTLWLARSLLAQRKPDEARSELEELIQRLEKEGVRPPEYVEACNVLAVIALQGATLEEKRAALDWLERALKTEPESVETLVQRSAVCRELARIASGDERESFLEGARRDLESADQVEPLSPLQHLMLAESWMNAGEFDRAAAHLKAVEVADPAAVGKDFIDPDDWVVARFIVAATFATRTGDITSSVAVADDALSTLTKARHRMEALRYAIPLYVAARRVSDARRSVDELLKQMKLIEPTPAQNEEAKYLEGLVALAEDKPYDAIRLLEPLVAGAAGGPRAQRLLAEAYVRVGRSERAVSTLRDYLRNEPEDLAMLANLVREHVKRGEWAEAVGVARRAEQIDPEDFELTLLRIRAQLGLLPNQPASAREALGTELLALREAHPQREEIAIYLARLAVQDGDMAGAEAELKRAIEVSDNGLRAALELAFLYANNGDVEEAIQVCQRACERHASDGGAWLSLGRLLTETGKHEEALDVLKRGSEAVANDEDKRLLLRELASVEILHGDRAAGIARLRRLAEERADDLRTRDTLLNVAEVLQDRTYANSLIEDIRSVEGETGLLWRLHRARFLLSSPDWRLPENVTQRREISQLLEFCVEASPDWQAPVLVLGRMYEILGQLPEAEQLYSAAFERDRETVAIAERLLSLFARQGRFDKARELLDRVRRGATASRWSDHAISLAIQSGEFSSAISELTPRLDRADVRAEDLITMANLVYLERQDADEAFAYLDRARVLAPESLDYVATKALMLKEEGRLDEAKQLIDEFAPRDKKDFASQLLRATFYHALGDSEQATGAYTLLPDLSEDSTGYATLGEYHARAGRLSDAIAVWEHGLERFPGDITLRRGIVKALIMRASPGDRERAEQMLKELRQEHPDDDDLAWVQAELELSKGTEESSEKALSLLLTAIQLNPYRVEPYLRAIPRLLDRGEFARAEDLAESALAIYPRDGQLLVAHAMVKLALGDVAAAQDLTRQALRAQPDSLQVVAAVADLAVRSGDFNLLRDIREQIGRAVEGQPENTRLQVVYAIALVVDGQPQAALTLAPEIIVTAVDILFGLATRAYERGDLEAAVDGYRRALELDPSNANILNNLAWTLAQAPRADASALEEALRYVDEAIRLAPRDPNLRDTRGFILSKLPNRLEEAQAEYEQCVELNRPSTPDRRAKALLRLGRTCARLDHKSKVRACLQEAREIDGQHDVFTPQEREEISRLLEQADAD
jgi:tetratricopeptide (TPR) repeat protein